MSEIDISKTDKAAVLMALYDNAQAQGLGALHYKPEPMTRDEAAKLLEENARQYFDYVRGRVMKVDLSGDTLSTRLYDRDNGEGAARRALERAGLLAI